MSGTNPDSNAETNAGDFGRFKSADTKARALANLKPPIQPGSPGLPGAGRPKRDAELHHELLRALNMRVPGDRERRTYKRKIVEALIKKAARGHVAAVHEVLDRTLGRVRWFDEPGRPSTIIVQINRNQVRDGAAEEQAFKHFVKPDKRRWRRTSWYRSGIVASRRTRTAYTQKQIAGEMAIFRQVRVQ